MTNFEVVTAHEQPNWGFFFWLLIMVGVTVTSLLSILLGSMLVAGLATGTDAYSVPWDTESCVAIGMLTTILYGISGLSLLVVVEELGDRSYRWF